jgi:hypothetical protein
MLIQDEIFSEFEKAVINEMGLTAFFTSKKDVKKIAKIIYELLPQIFNDDSKKNR